MSTWKTREEAYHGTKWGYVVVALVIGIILFLIWTIFAALKGYPFIEYLSPSTGVFIVLVFIFFVLIAGKEAPLALVSNPFILAMLIILPLAAFFMVIGVGTTYLAAGTIILLVLLLILSLKHIIAISASSWFTLVVILTLIVFVSFLFLLGSNIPTANIIIAIIAFLLLVAFFPFAIFIVDLFSLEEE